MFSADNEIIAIPQIKDFRASQNQAASQVSVWNLRTGKPLKTFIAEQNKSVRPLAILNDGQLLLRTTDSYASGDAASSSFLWDPKTGNRGKTPLSKLADFSYGVMSPDGKEFAIGDDTGLLQRLNLSTGAVKAQRAGKLTQTDYVSQFGENSPGLHESATGSLKIWGIDYSLNGSYLASRNDAQISVYDSKTREIGALTISANSSMFFSMSPDGKWLAASGSLPYSPEGNLLWNVKTGQKIRLQTPFENLLDFGFSQDGKQLHGIFAKDAGFQSESLQFVTWQTDATPVTSFNVIESTQFQREFASQLSTDAVAAVSKTGKLLAIPGESAIEIYQPTGTLVNKLFVGSPKPKVIEFSPDDALLAFDQRNGDASDVEVWSWKGTPLRVASFKSERPATALAFSPDGKSLVFGDENGTVRWYDIGTKKLKAQVNAGESALALGIADRALTVLGRRNIKSYRWPLVSGSEPRRTDETGAQVLASADSAVHLAMSADGEALATTQTDGRIQLWNLKKGSLSQVLRGDQENVINQIHGLTFSADGTRIMALADANSRATEMSTTSWSLPKTK